MARLVSKPQLVSVYKQFASELGDNFPIDQVVAPLQNVDAITIANANEILNPYDQIRYLFLQIMPYKDADCHQKLIEVLHELKYNTQANFLEENLLEDSANHNGLQPNISHQICTIYRDSNRSRFNNAVSYQVSEDPLSPINEIHKLTLGANGFDDTVPDQKALSSQSPCIVQIDQPQQQNNSANISAYQLCRSFDVKKLMKSLSGCCWVMIFRIAVVTMCVIALVWISYTHWYTHSTLDTTGMAVDSSIYPNIKSINGQIKTIDHQINKNAKQISEIWKFIKGENQNETFYD